MTALGDTAREAQRAKLLATLEECAWNMHEAARRLGANAANLQRSVRTLLATEYAVAKADGRIRRGGNRARVDVRLTSTAGCERVGE